jgi:hypothetical protein
MQTRFPHLQRCVFVAGVIFSTVVSCQHVHHIAPPLAVCSAACWGASCCCQPCPTEEAKAFVTGGDPGVGNCRHQRHKHLWRLHNHLHRL